MDKKQQILVARLCQILSYHNRESADHVCHISSLTEILLKELLETTDCYPLTKQECDEIVLASTLHDIGKIGVDTKILNKPGRLTKAELETVKAHAIVGASIIEDIKKYQESSLLKITYQVCRWHHERYDGKGYPDGLAGEEIPISAQIVALADVYDALTSERVYKAAYAPEQAIEMILNGECGAFNPKLLALIKEPDIAQRMKEIVQTSYSLKVDRKKDELFSDIAGSVD